MRTRLPINPILAAQSGIPRRGKRLVERRPRPGSALQTAGRVTREGRRCLTHGDVVNPFKRSVGGHFRYVLVLVDEHSRYKAVHFLQKKSDALKEVRKYVASLNAHLNRGQAHPTKSPRSSDRSTPTTLESYTEFIDSESIKQTN